MKSFPLSENRSWEAGFYGILFKVKTFLSKISNLCEFQLKKTKTKTRSYLYVRTHLLTYAYDHTNVFCMCKIA